MTTAIIELAKKLGRAITDSPAAADMMAARKAIDDNAEVGKLYKDFQEQSLKLARLQSEHKPIEVDDKHKLRDLNDKLIGSGEFKKYTAAQVEYADLMRRVNEAMQAEMSKGSED